MVKRSINTAGMERESKFFINLIIDVVDELNRLSNANISQEAILEKINKNLSKSPLTSAELTGATHFGQKPMSQSEMAKARAEKLFEELLRDNKKRKVEKKEDSFEKDVADLLGDKKREKRKVTPKQKVDKPRKKEKAEEKESDISKGFKNIKEFGEEILSLTGLDTVISSIKNLVTNIGQTFHTLFIKPLKAVFFLTKSVFSLLIKPFSFFMKNKDEVEDDPTSEYAHLAGEAIDTPLAGGAAKSKALLKQQKESEEKTEEQEEQTGLLKAIAGFLTPSTAMLKGSGLMSDLLKGGGIAGTLSRMLGAGLITGGILWMINDFMKGFSEGGFGSGIMKMLFGEAKGGIMGVMKNAGKFAMIGGGIGLMVAGPLGGVIGGLAGAAIGGLVNATYQLIKGPGTGSEKVATAVFGGIEGPMSTVFSGMKWASMGFLIGLPFGGPIGGLIGAGIGFVVGSLVNIVWQMIGEDGRKAVTTFFDKTAEWMGHIWDAFSGFFTGMYESIQESITASPVLSKIDKWITENLIDPVVNFFSSIGSSIASGFSNWWNGGSEDKKKTKTKKKSSGSGGLFDSVGGLMSGGGTTPVTAKLSDKQAKEQNQVIEKMSKGLDDSLKLIYNFMKGDMIKKLKNITSENTDIMLQGMDAISLQNRMWQEFKEGRTPAEAIDNFKKFQDFMDKTNSGSNKQDMKQVQINNVDNRTNIQNNVSGSEHVKLKSRRK
jgi:hypothetical protein